MSEQSEKWAVMGGGSRVKCPKYGILINDCAHHLDCETCIEETGLAPETPSKKKHGKK